MKEEINALVQLQECDNEIQIILAKKEEGPSKIKILQDALSASELKFREDSSKLETLKKDRLNLEQEVHESEGKIEKSNTKLSNIKSNKEYQAALNEIEELKKIKIAIEDKIIQLMEEIEDTEKICLDNRDRRQELKDQFESTRNVIDKELVGLNKSLKKMDRRRKKLTNMIDQNLLRRYSFLKDRKSGLAITAVIGAVCQACHMNLPPQRFNELIQGHSLMECPNCNRMIYWGEEDSLKEASV